MPSFEQGRESLDTPITPKSSNKASNEDAVLVTPRQVADDESAPTSTPVVAAGPASTEPAEGVSEETRARIEKVLQSDIGINTLLTRLKQSISSVKDFSTFLKERAALEEKHARGLKKLSRDTNELIRRPDNRQGTFGSSYEEMTRIQDRMADHGMEFAQEVQLMADQLRELAADTEQGRKHWKHVGLDAEQRAQEAEATMDKAKSRYFQLAEQYDKARTGEKQTGMFTLKGPKSAQQQEEALLGKVENADVDYSSKVQAAQVQRHELLNSSRPQAVKEMRALILSCDAGLSALMAKFAALSERLLLHNGLSVSPLKTLPNGAPSYARSLRESVAGISNNKDFEDYVISHASSVGPPHPDIKYEKHFALQPTTQQPIAQPQASVTSNQSAAAPPAAFVSSAPQRRETDQSSFGSHMEKTGYQTGPGASQGVGPPQLGQGPPQPGQALPSAPPHLPLVGAGPMGGRTGGDAQPPSAQRPPGGDYRNFSGPPQHRPNQASFSGPQSHQRYASGSNQQYGGYGPPQGRGQPPAGQYQTMPPPGPYGNGQAGGAGGGYGHQAQKPSFGPPGDLRPDAKAGPPQGYGYANPEGRGLPSQNDNYRSYNSQNGGGQGYAPGSAPPVAKQSNVSLPPLRPVFGVSLDELFRRDASAVPAIVYQCVQAVDMFGLNTEGIYRTSGSAQHVTELRALFDHDSSQVDFRDPVAFHNDVAAVTTLLKHFLRELKDPLLTSAQYHDFIRVAQIDDDITRRDSLHALINSLPDPNYATLRTLVLHLHRVSQNSSQNRMTAANLALIFGPTLLSSQASGPSSEIKDAAWQSRVVETILSNTLQIFDDDE